MTPTLSWIVMFSDIYRMHLNVWCSCGVVGSSSAVGLAQRYRQGEGGDAKNITPTQDRIKTGGDHWQWPCTFHLQILIKLLQCSIDLSHNNPFRLSLPGHVGPLQLFMAEYCASFCWDATMCSGKPLNSGEQGTHRGWKGRHGRLKKRTGRRAKEKWRKE